MEIFNVVLSNGSYTLDPRNKNKLKVVNKCTHGDLKTELAQGSRRTLNPGDVVTVSNVFDNMYGQYITVIAETGTEFDVEPKNLEWIEQNEAVNETGELLNKKMTKNVVTSLLRNIADSIEKEGIEGYSVSISEYGINIVNISNLDLDTLIPSLEEDCSLLDVITLSDSINPGESILVHGFKFTKYLDAELGVMMENKVSSVYPIDILRFIAGEYGDKPS